jgi:hypothetical protein
MLLKNPGNSWCHAGDATLLISNLKTEMVTGCLWWKTPFRETATLYNYHIVATLSSPVLAKTRNQG